VDTVAVRGIGRSKPVMSRKSIRFTASSPQQRAGDKGQFPDPWLRGAIPARPGIISSVDA
jgi:hypothetical protein